MAQKLNVLLITYRRHSHLTEIFRILKLANANIFVYQNKPEGAHDKKHHNHVREIIVDHGNKNTLNFFEPPTHLGSAQSIKYAITKFFENVENGIVIEDDCIPKDNVNDLFNHLVENYKKNSIISLYDPNPLTQETDTPSIVRTPFLHVWGWYCNRDIWGKFISCETTLNIQDLMSYLKASGVNKKNRIYWYFVLKLIQYRKIDSWDYEFWLFLVQNQTDIYCMIGNQIDNRGSDEFATFASKTDNRQDKLSYGNLNDLDESTTYTPNDVCRLHYCVSWWRLLTLSAIWIRSCCLN